MSEIRRDITVCIPTVNRAKELAVALSSVLGQTFRPYRVIIALDGTLEQQKEIEQDALLENIILALGHTGTEVMYLHNQGEHGIGQIKNAYIKTLESEWFLQLEDDAWLSPDYIEKLVKSDGFSKHTTAGLAGIQLLPILPDQAGWSDHSFERQESAPGMFNELAITPSEVKYVNKAQVYRYNVEAVRAREFQAMCYLHTYMLRTDYVRKVQGGWDLRFSNPAVSFAFEEVDASYALFMAGYDLKVVIDAEMWHFRSPNRLGWRTNREKIKAGYEAHAKLFIEKWNGKEREYARAR